MNQKLLYDYALRFVGVPYKYGGLSPMEGLDCSSLVRLLLHSAHVDYGNAYTAQTLFEFFSKASHISTPQLGSLAFYGNSTSDIDHVSLCLDENTQIEAAGGNSLVIDLESAIKAHAFVKVTPIRQTNRIAVLMPYYPNFSTP